MGLYRLNTKTWYVERAVYVVGGLFIMVTAVLGLFVNKNFIYATEIIGAFMAIFGITGWCGMAIIISKLGLKSNIKK